MFVSGRELSRRFYQEQVRPVLHSGYPGLPYSAALLGRGSEVLGFDDEMSRDHNWEPRVLLFLRDADHARYGEAVERSLRDALPARFAGYPTQFSSRPCVPFCRSTSISTSMLGSKRVTG